MDRGFVFKQINNYMNCFMPGDPKVDQRWPRRCSERGPCCCLTVELFFFFFFKKSRHCLSSSLSSCVLSATTSTTSLWTCPCRLERGGSWDFKVRGSVQAWRWLFTKLIVQMKPNGIPVKGYNVYYNVYCNSCLGMSLNSKQPHFFWNICFFFLP